MGHSTVLNKREQKIMNFLRRQAIDVEPVKSSRIAAALIVKNTVISTGYNSYRTHPFQAKYSKNPKAICMHAEIRAIHNALNHLDKEDFKKATLMIYRVKIPPTEDKKVWVDGMAKPCEGCMRAIVAFGIKKIVYTTEKNGEYDIDERNSFICV